MKAIGIILIIWGCLGVVISAKMFGDIGIACFVGSLASTLAGIGFLIGNNRIKKLSEMINKNEVNAV